MFKFAKGVGLLVAGCLGPIALIVVGVYACSGKPPEPEPESTIARQQREAHEAWLKKPQAPSLAAVQPPAPAPQPAPEVDDRPRTSNGKTAFDIELACKSFIREKVDDVDFPGWGDRRLPEPVVTEHGAVWKGWFRAPNVFNAKIRHRFACRYVAKTDMLTVHFDE